MVIDISSDDSAYLYTIIDKIIDECGPRMPCSEEEAHAADIIKSELDKVCDETKIEPFSCHPRAFLGFIKINVFLVFISFLIFFFQPLEYGYFVSLLFSLIIFILNAVAFVIIWNEFFNYREFIDPLFKKRHSQNVVGTIRGEGEMKKILIFSGHHDSALQFNLLRYLKVGYGIIIFLGLGIMVFWLVCSLFYFLSILLNFDTFQILFNIAFWTFIIGIVPLIALFNFVSPGIRANKVPGAVDNLSAVSIVIGIARYLQKHKKLIPNNTEIRLISFGCEEAGLRGAYRYVEEHEEELKELDAENINMDGIMNENVIKFVEYEPTTRTEHSAEVVRKLVAAAENAQVKAEPFGSGGMEKLIGQISGGTDATAFSKAGIKASTISAMQLKKFFKFYHQPTDTLDMIQKGSLEKVLKICLGYLKVQKKENN
jgi:acetylornithine deacetylase/succinyl-diaminopimelate desuccinylase-like protein